MSERDRTQNPNTPRPMAGCYAVPIRFLYGTASEINFWDVVCFHAHQNDGAFDTSTQELVEDMGFSRQVIGRLRREAVEQGSLRQDVSWVSGNRFVLRLPDFPLTRGVVWKPLGYVSQGWQHLVTPAIPKRVLNLYLQQPRQQVYRLDTGYVAAKCKRRFPYQGGRASSDLNLADVGKALRHLVRLGLLVPEAEGFRIDWETFTQPAPVDGPVFDEPDPQEHPLFQQAAASDPERAKRALELLEVGRYDLETHFAAIFRDLTYVRPSDYTVLKAKVYRHRNRPPGTKRWLNTWRAFQYELERRISQVRAPKQVLELDKARSYACHLALDLDQRSGQVLAVRLVSRVEWPWFLTSEPEGKRAAASGVQLELRTNGRVLFVRTVEPGDAEVRHTIHPDLWPDPSAPLTLTARCPQPLPGLHVEAWLEARLRR